MGVNVLAGLFSLVGLAFAVFNIYLLLPFLINILAVGLSMVAFKAKNSLLFWVPIFLIAGTVLNALAILLAAKDYLFGEGVKWVKVEGEHYHKGVELKAPLRK
jgi:hypothetical protein